MLEGGPDFEIFIFFGNVGGKNSGPGEMAMQVPYGTRLISADPLSYNPLEGTTSTTAFFPPNYFTIQQIKGKRRAEDGPIEVVRWKFPNIAPSNVYCVKMKVQVTKPFPGTSIVDKSAYVTSTYSAAKVSTPLIIKVRKDANGATDWWQAVGDLLQSFGFGVDDSVRNLLGEDTKSITLGSTTASIGGVDAVQLVGGQLILPLGQGRSLIIGPGSQLFSGQVPNESMISASEGDGLAMAAGATSSQQVYVGGTINDYRNVHTLLDQLASSTNSIVAAGGGNIVAAGGGNIVAAGGGNIVAGGGGNVVSNDGAGFVGHVNFSNIPSIVAAGGGNIVAAGGGNIVAGGGGNIVAAGGGNIVAAGGGNIVAAGGGNLVEIGSRQIQPKDMTGLINSLIGQEGANLTDVVLLKQIGANVLSNDGAGVVVLDPNSLIGQDAASLIGQDGAGIVAGGGLNNQ